MPFRFSAIRIRCSAILMTALFAVLPIAPVWAQALPTHKSAEARNGMVASASGLASQVGVDIMKHGGNAVDAAVAVGLALAVVYPEAGNLGGGGFMLIRLADGRSTAIDYREVAPALASRTTYLDKSGAVIKGASLVGYRTVGVPGFSKPQSDPT